MKRIDALLAAEEEIKNTSLILASREVFVEAKIRLQGTKLKGQQGRERSCIVRVKVNAAVAAAFVLL